VLTTLSDPIERKIADLKDSVLPRWREIFQYRWTVLRSGIIGVLTGLLPGVGEDAGAWMSYAAAKAASKEPEKFGKGSIDGLMAPRPATCPPSPATSFPAWPLGIPARRPRRADGGDDHPRRAARAHADDPEPALHLPRGGDDDAGLDRDPAVRPVRRAAAAARAEGAPQHPDAHRVPALHGRRLRHRLAACSTSTPCWPSALARTSCVAAATRWRRWCWGLVLGPLLDKSLRRGLVLSDGSILPFFTRPIALAFAVVTIFTILLYVKPFKAAVQRVKSGIFSGLRMLFARRA
jgi:putative tricarboxylic transport membrane protein